MPKSFDVRILPPNSAPGDEIPFMFGSQGGVKLGNFLKEPSPKGRVDSILIQSLHHGAGRLLGTDPFCYRDGNSDTPGDVRQFGFISAGGAYAALPDPIGIGDHGPLLDSEDRPAQGAACFIDAGNLAVFAVGCQMFTIDPEDDTPTEVDLSSVSGFDDSTMTFTGSVAFWHGQFILGLCDSNRVAVGSMTYPGLDFFDDGTGENPSGELTGEYKVSWIASTAQGLFWIQNRGSGDPPRMFWTDRTDQDWGDFSEDPDETVNFLFGPFFLEIPTLEVSGMGVAGTVPIFASADQMLWAFDSTEVFVPLSPLNMQRNDSMYGRSLPYVLDWMMVPSKNGVDRFDPRSYQTVDITPGAHQGAWVGFTNSDNFMIEACNTTPTGAAVVTRFGSANPAIQLLEVYNDGMFWHLGPEIEMDYSLGIIYNTAATLRPRLYLIGVTETDYTFARYDMSGPGAQVSPETFAATSSVRTPHLSGRPPDVSVQPTQVRGWAHGSETNPINISLELDGSSVDVGQITEDGPYCLQLPEETIPCRRIAFVSQFVVGTDSDPPYVALPVSVDYIYVPPAGSLTPDLLTIDFESAANQIDKLTGHRFAGGTDESDELTGMQGQAIEITFAGRELPWRCIVQEATYKMANQEDGLAPMIYLISMALKRVK